MLSRALVVLATTLLLAACSDDVDFVPGPDPSEVPAASAFGSTIDEGFALRLDESQDGTATDFTVPTTGRLVLRGACSAASFIDIRVKVDGVNISDSRSCFREPDEESGVVAYDLTDDDIQQGTTGTIRVTAYGAAKSSQPAGVDNDADRFERAGKNARWALVMSVSD